MRSASPKASAGGSSIAEPGSLPAPATGSPPPVRVFIVAEVRLYRDGLAQVLEHEEGMSVAGAMACAPDVVGRVRAEAPDVVLLDMEAPDALGLVRSLTGDAAGTRVIALAVPDRDHYLLSCVEAGAAGYVTRDQSVEDVAATIRSVARGEANVSPRMVARLLQHVSALAAGVAPAEPTSRLTAREREIVQLIDHGMSNKQIARELGIELATVKNHVHNVLEKLHVNRRSEAVARMRAHDLARGLRLDEGLPEI